MSNVQPAEASVEAFNNALFLFGDDVSGLRSAEWRLRSLYQRSHRDVTAALGLLTVWQMLGEREESLQLATELWGRRASLDGRHLMTLAVSQLSLGQFERAIELTASFHETSSTFSAKQHNDLIRQAWLCTWSRNLFRHRVQDELLKFPDIEEKLLEAKLLSVMEERQLLVNQIIIPRQCSFEIFLGLDGDGELKLTRISYVTGDYRSRRELSDNVSLALDDFYCANSIDDSYARDTISEVILPAAAQSPTHEPTAQAWA